MNSNENAKANPKKLGKLRGCALILFGLTIIILIFGIISGESEDATEKKEEKQQGKPEQVEKDSLAIKQAKKDSLLREVNVKYNSISFTTAHCATIEEMNYIKSLIEQGANVKAADTLGITNVLADFEEYKKNMSTIMQGVRKVTIESGENIETLEKAYNMDLKKINDSIKNCKELKKVLVKNLKENQ